MKRSTVNRSIVSLALLASILGPGIGQAVAAPAEGGCPSDFRLVSANRNELGDTVDKNGDGKICLKSIPAFPPGSVNIIDNNTP